MNFFRSPKGPSHQLPILALQYRCQNTQGMSGFLLSNRRVDRVLPVVPVRQWVLSLPFQLRYRLAYDSGLARDVLRIFIQEVFSSLRRRACQHCGIRKAKCGGVTFVQRFGGAINLNIHFHSLLLDGVYYEDENKRICFQRLPASADAEVALVTANIVKKVHCLLERRGLGRQAGKGSASIGEFMQICGAACCCHGAFIEAGGW